MILNEQKPQKKKDQIVFKETADPLLILPITGKKMKGCGSTKTFKALKHQIDVETVIVILYYESNFNVMHVLLPLNYYEAALNFTVIILKAPNVTLKRQ